MNNLRMTAQNQFSNLSVDNTESYHYKVTTFNIFFAVMEMLFIPVIIIGNGLVIASICVFRRLFTLTNCFLVSLSVSDLIVALLVIPLYAAFYLKPDLLSGNRAACLAWFGSVILGCGASLLNLLVIILDRFLAIHFPFWYARYKSGRNVGIVLSFLWVYIVVLSLLPMMGWNNWASDKLCDFYTSLPVAYVILAAYVTVGTVTVLSSLLFAKIFATVMKHKRQIHAQTVAGKQEKKWLEGEVKSTRVSAVVFLLFIIFWAPYFCVGPLKYSSLSQDVVEVIKNGSLMLGFGNSFVNPIVYSLLQKQFRAAFRLLLTTRVTQWKKLERNILVREEEIPQVTLIQTS